MNNVCYMEVKQESYLTMVKQVAFNIRKISTIISRNDYAFSAGSAF